MARSMLAHNLDSIQPDGTLLPTTGEHARPDEPGHVAFALGEFYRATGETTLKGFVSRIRDRNYSQRRTDAFPGGFVQQHVTSIGLDSLDGMSGVDSARLAADLTRLASALPDDTSKTFRGIPFSVRYAFRFQAASGVDAVVADLVRRLNQEASPLEQHTLLIAERIGAASDTPFRVAYHERTGGLEEAIETTDVLAALRLSSPPHVALVVLREGQDTSAFAMLERQADGSWRVRWTSVHTGC